jgi:hypothetical protein
MTGQYLFFSTNQKSRRHLWCLDIKARDSSLIGSLSFSIMGMGVTK